MKNASEVLSDWQSLSSAEKSSRLARKFAKRCGMKSMAEVQCAAWLEQHKVPFKYESERWVYQYKPATYRPDFLLNGFAIEVKGKLTAEVRRKLLAVMRSNPDKKLYLVFERANNKIRGGSKTTYGDWATKAGIPWSEHTPDKGWFKHVSKRTSS